MSGLSNHGSISCNEISIGQILYLVKITNEQASMVYGLDPRATDHPCYVVAKPRHDLVKICIASCPLKLLLARD